MSTTGPTDIDQQVPRSVTDLLSEHSRIAMVMTMVDGAHSSRPVTIADVGERRLSFMVSRSTAWVQSIVDQVAVVHVTVSNEAHNVYLALNGTALVVHDGAELERLWSPIARAWFSGPDDPDLAVLHFDVSDGEYWDGPSGRLGRVVAMLHAALGDDSDGGAHGPVIGNG
jgi:general stress protein 26